jgi:hypothetical protein
MSSLNSAFIKTEKLKEILHILEQKQAKGLELTISISDTGNDYGQNVSVFVSQTKEQRDAKKPKFYVGNGKTFWTDGKIVIPQKMETNEAGITQSDDIPF